MLTFLGVKFIVIQHSQAGAHAGSPIKASPAKINPAPMVIHQEPNQTPIPVADQHSEACCIGSYLPRTLTHAQSTRKDQGGTCLTHDAKADI